MKHTKHFEALFRRLQPRLFAFCLKYVDDEELARDFVQECFVRLWERYDSVEISHESYLFMAVRNRCISHFRNLKIKADYAMSVRLRIKEIELHSEMPDPLTQMYIGEIDELLQKSLKHLPEKCRIVFQMSRNPGMKNREIADQLGISTRTVEAHIHSALKVIKKYFCDYIPGD